MSWHHDPELDDLLQDDELRRLATLLSSAARPEPPVDDAFRSGLRRQLMQQAWSMSEGRDSWWRRAFAPPGLAWLGAAAGVLLIASVATYMALQPAGGLTELHVSSSLDGSKGVALAQPILVSFNQPMNHPSTEAAVQITPATTVTFAWASNDLYVQPTSGNLAPNTQYQVTIGPGAQTAAGVKLAAPQTITFVTQPPPAPTPAPSPRPSPTAGSPVGERSLATLGGATTAPLQWSADSSAIYFVNAKGALELVSTKGGDPTVIAPDGVSSPVVSPAADRLAYIRGGKIEVLTFAAGSTQELAPTPVPTLLGWAKDKLVWAAADGIYEQGATTPSQLAPLPSDGSVTVLSLAPDGTHAVYQQNHKLVVLDLATAASFMLGQPGARFLGWSPDGTLLLYTNDGSAIIVADMLGNNSSTLPAGEPSWSTQDAILLGSDTDLFQVRPDASSLTRLSTGTYRQPQWAPNGATFSFFRGGQLWIGTAPALPAQPSLLDSAAAVVNSFMQARLKNQPDQATAYLDSAGKQAYSAGGLSLTINDDPAFSRYYILTQELSGSQPVTARFVVRLVLTHGKIDVADFEETLTLARDPATNQFLVDQATAGPHRGLGKGAEVVGVTVAADSIQITFDSDLDPGTVPGGIVLVDSKGKPVDTTLAYANKMVTISGLSLKPGDQYRLVVSTSVRDVLGHNVAAEYDLDIVGPAAANHHLNKRDGGAPVTVSPSPAPGPTSTPGG
ncbi:MAG TPA: Ig-like domain-containing protein [Candidatus Dormibacteraeota bacterium]